MAGDATFYKMRGALRRVVQDGRWETQNGGRHTFYKAGGGALNKVLQGGREETQNKPDFIGFLQGGRQETQNGSGHKLSQCRRRLEIQIFTTLAAAHFIEFYKASALHRILQGGRGAEAHSIQLYKVGSGRAHFIELYKLGEWRSRTSQKHTR